MLELKLRNFIAQYSDIPREKVNLLKYEYDIPFTFDEFETILTIRKNRNKYEILIRDQMDEEFPCLIFEVFEENKRRQGYVSLIKTLDKHCQIPSQKAGTWMMQLLNHLIDLWKIQYVELEDLSWIKCPNDGQHTSLFFLQIYKKSQSWYENFGFEIINNKTRYTETIKKYINLDMTSVAQFIDQYPSYPINGQYSPQEYQKAKVLYPQVLKILASYPPQNITLGQYMTQLWSQNCTDYIILDHFLAYSAKIKYHMPWAQFRILLTKMRHFSKGVLN